MDIIMLRAGSVVYWLIIEGLAVNKGLARIHDGWSTGQYRWNGRDGATEDPDIDEK